MAKKTEKFDPKGMEELHINEIGVFWYDRKNLKAYHYDGRSVEQGSPLWICPHGDCIAWKEMVFAKHMVEKHPEQANKKLPVAKRLAKKKG